MQITHGQFLALSSPPSRSAEIDELRELIHAASFPDSTSQGQGFHGKKDKDPLKFRLDVTGTPGAEGGTEQLSIAFTKPLGSQAVQMRAYQGTQLSTNDNDALLHVTFNKPDQGKKTASLEWIGNRPEQPPANVSGSQLMKTFQGLMAGSGCECSLKDASGKMIDPNVPQAGEIKLKVTGAYNQGKTWYMTQGATPANEVAWNNATQKLSKLKVSDVKQELGKMTTTGEGSSGMSIRQIIDAAAPHIAAASNGKYPDAQAVQNNMPLGEFYREMSKPGMLQKLERAAAGHNTRPAHMAHDVYTLAMERKMPNDPNPELKAAADTVMNASSFVFHFPTGD